MRAIVSQDDWVYVVSYSSALIVSIGDIDISAFVLNTNMSLWMALATAIMAMSASSVS